jgi:hypothetical protein
MTIFGGMEPLPSFESEIRVNDIKSLVSVRENTGRMVQIQVVWDATLCFSGKQLHIKV